MENGLSIIPIPPNKLIIQEGIEKVFQKEFGAIMMPMGKSFEKKNSVLIKYIQHTTIPMVKSKNKEKRE